MLFYDKIVNINNSANNINYYNKYLKKRAVKTNKNRLNLIEINFEEGNNFMPILIR